MGRTPAALIQARAEKCSTLAQLLNNICELTDSDIDRAPIKASDRKLLRRAQPEIQKQKQLEAMVKAMPVHDTPEEQFDLYVYQGPETQYDGLEIATGTVVSYTDHWIRFDHLRLKRKQSIEHILEHCEFVLTGTISEVNRYIGDTVNSRHGVTPTEPVKNSTQRMFSARDFW